MAPRGPTRRCSARQHVARLLEQTLKEEKAADRTLTNIAESSMNDEAAEEFQSQSGSKRVR